MKDKAIAICVVIVLAFFSSISFTGESQSESGGKLDDERQVTGPYVYKNLAIYLVHGPDKIKTKEILTLQEALEKKVVEVNETGNVGQLAVVNLSDSAWIFIQSGDIVKGGKQDRVLATDMLLPPKSGKVSIQSFCVEQGRWEKRGKESKEFFQSSNDVLSTKQLKYSVRNSRNQHSVWKDVTKTQDSLNSSLRSEVRAETSKSSLQLSLENKRLLVEVKEYTEKLSPLIDNHSPAGKVVGYAFAINGKINSVDIYGSNALFRKLWPKMLKASAVEAVVNLPPSVPSSEKVVAFINSAPKNKVTKDESTNAHTVYTVKEGEKTITYETKDKQNNQLFHQSIINAEDINKDNGSSTIQQNLNSQNHTQNLNSRNYNAGN